MGIKPSGFLSQTARLVLPDLVAAWWKTNTSEARKDAWLIVLGAPSVIAASVAFIFPAIGIKRLRFLLLYFIKRSLYSSSNVRTKV